MKRLTWILAALLLASTLVACGQPTTTTEGKSSAAPKATNTADEENTTAVDTAALKDSETSAADNETDAQEFEEVHLVNYYLGDGAKDNQEVFDKANVFVPPLSAPPLTSLPVRE